MKEPAWLEYARKFLGLREIPGIESNPVIVNWLIKLRAWWRDDSTPWCGLFVAVCISESGIALPKHWYRARDWLNWGQPLSFPVVGAVVVYERKGGGHVGFIVGKDQNGDLMTLGGNQGDRVSIAPFSRDRVLGYRWPAAAVVVLAELPILASGPRVSTA
jgi:uncharacterized protein (TIGR02594 family)